MRPDEFLDEGAWLLAGFALPEAEQLVAEVEKISAAAPFRHLTVPTGGTMSVAMTNCGRVGWFSDRRGYRYTRQDPLSDRDWPAMPDLFLALARRAGEHAGYKGFDPDACLINRYEPDAKMGLHQDRDEGDLTQPIVSVSLGVPAVFLWGGKKRADKTRRFAVEHGDVVVWGGPSRLVFHGVMPLKEAEHPLTGMLRYNLTFRSAL